MTASSRTRGLRLALLGAGRGAGEPRGAPVAAAEGVGPAREQAGAAVLVFDDGHGQPV